MLDKIDTNNLLNEHSESEDIQANSGFKIASLVLYGTNALPVRLKILLDKMFAGLTREEAIKILDACGWTLEDYSRGYKTQVRRALLSQVIPSTHRE